MKNILFCVFFAFINARSKWHLTNKLSTKIASILEKSTTICKYKINECLYVVDTFFTSQTLKSGRQNNQKLQKCFHCNHEF
jgi:hypothetical protein